MSEKTVHVLGANWREASAYGKEHGVEATFVTTPAQLRSAYRIVVLPSFKRRRDGAELAAALRTVERYARNGVRVKHVQWEWDEPKVDPYHVHPYRQPEPQPDLVGAAKTALQSLADQRGLTL